VKWAAITIILAAATLASALRAAWLWWKASMGERRLASHLPGSPDHVVQMETEAADAALLNAKAALWSGGTAIFSALTAIWGAMKAFF